MVAPMPTPAPKCNSLSWAIWPNEWLEIKSEIKRNIFFILFDLLIYYKYLC
jgi:hypothetical protein